MRRSQKNEDLIYSLQLVQIDPAPPKGFLREEKITSSKEKKDIDSTNDSLFCSSQRFSVILQTRWIDVI